MNLAELTQEVYSITGRPDRATETASAIRQATLKAHQSDYYVRDIFECALRFNTAEYIQNFDYKAVIPLWRALKYLRKCDSTGAPTYGDSGILKIIPPENILDGYGLQKTNQCYIAGAFIQINAMPAQQFFLLGCYLNPNITDSGYNSWIAQDHPFAIILDAAATVFKAIGKDEEAAAYRSLVGEQIMMLKTSAILGEGY